MKTIRRQSQRSHQNAPRSGHAKTKDIYRSARAALFTVRPAYCFQNIIALVLTSLSAAGTRVDAATHAQSITPERWVYIRGDAAQRSPAGPLKSSGRILIRP